ncbi:ribosomal protection-like ABC-F family protein [Caminibacter pacificus]|uniref:ABC-F family ATP-binding cassette domain-containing protein n=1 Tax=Caminibacter pacificus TaxID=1424653 RepID=A0AAJ4RE38_9BACT|nr:ABC-F family ATP-binding cassette domain-containing protein [Caminibacter pacificus]NPA88281.1 ABC-F family ATP-binding cassette domain-containing protein [Campylobacterota bacterium]QCI28318.1 ABC-F family ATP-binding cassette domain-containing protein [Caminibacter pacificus]ROR40968.1 ATP-binding cassette subfamily F protein uup [Caminibacter pacificus]
MALIDLLDVSKKFEAQKILCNVEFHLDEGERVALIGKNGSGKSTLMKIIDGTIEPDSGEVITKNGIKIKRLLQQPKFNAGVSVREAIENELTEFKEAYEKYLKLTQEFSENPDNKAIQNELDKITKFLDFHNAWNLDDRIERVLQEFDLKKYENKDISLLSGGEQRRVALASLLLQKPDVLLLDEPTNHLDVYMTEFLEDMLLKEKYTFIVVSHDRYFIDRIATRVVELENCKLRSFKGGYADYIRQKEELLKIKEKEYENELRLLKREEEWLRRGVKARLKRNEGRKKRVLELREKVKQDRSEIRKIEMQLKRELLAKEDEKINKKKVMFEIENLTKSIGNKLLIKDFTTRILQKDKIAIVGKNGAGKSTLLKLLIGEEKPDSGIIKVGENLKIGYLDQRKSMLDDNKDLIETFCPQGGDHVNVRGRNMHVYGYLREFLFPPEYLTKKIGVLSGGEKTRVALALLFTKDFDILILDEPTNDLDIPTINILEEYLIDFEGSVIFVSHDRYFVDKVAKKLFIFKGDGIVEESHIPYTEYLEIEKELKLLEKEVTKIENTKKEKPKPKKQKKLSYKEQKELEELPKLIEELENTIAEIEECLANPECYQEKGLVSLSEELEEIKKIYDEKVERYLELEEKKEELENLG